MKDFVVAAQLFTLRDLLKDQPREKVEDTLKQVKEMGYDAVQISGIGKVTKELAKMYMEICKDLELDICATHAGLNDFEEDIDWMIEYHQMWDCKYAGIGAMGPELRNADGVLEFAERANNVGAKLKEAGITLVYHNHKFEYEKKDGKTWMDMLFDAFDPECVEFELDTYWVQAGGANPVSWINKVDGRMSVVHFKDMKILSDEQQFTEIGNGNLEWPEIIDACINTGVKYAAVEQDRFTDDPLASMAMSRKYLTTVM